MFAKGSASLSASDEKYSNTVEFNKFQSSQFYFREISIGSDPYGTVEEWYENTRKAPMPIDIKLESITSLIT